MSIPQAPTGPGEFGHLGERQLPDGRWLTLYPLLFGAGRLAVEQARWLVKCPRCGFTARPGAGWEVGELHTATRPMPGGPKCGGTLERLEDRDGGYDEAYEWTEIEQAHHAFETWDGEGEPLGWYRHRPSNRRRPGGNPAREEVRP